MAPVRTSREEVDRLPENLVAVATALAPVRQALIDEAEAEATAIRRRAREAADERVAQAQAASDQEVQRAVKRHERSAQAVLDQTMATERNRAHRSALVRRFDHWETLVEQTRISVRAMRLDPRYPQLLVALAQRVAEQLGPDADIVVDGGVVDGGVVDGGVVDGGVVDGGRDSDVAGGVVGVIGQRRVDYSLDALAIRALAALADDVAEVTGR